MESGVFESVNGCNNNKFENTSTKLYRFKSLDNLEVANCNSARKENKENVQPPDSKGSKNIYEIGSLRKMLDYLREKPKNTENSRHNCS